MILLPLPRPPSGAGSTAARGSRPARLQTVTQNVVQRASVWAAPTGNVLAQLCRHPSSCWPSYLQCHGRGCRLSPWCFSPGLCNHPPRARPRQEVSTRAALLARGVDCVPGPRFYRRPLLAHLPGRTGRRSFLSGLSQVGKPVRIGPGLGPAGPGDSPPGVPLGQRHALWRTL